MLQCRLRQIDTIEPKNNESSNLEFQENICFCVTNIFVIAFGLMIVLIKTSFLFIGESRLVMAYSDIMFK